jgi:tetratricopeptide (TPR) repeat protein
MALIAVGGVVLWPHLIKTANPSTQPVVSNTGPRGETSPVVITTTGKKITGDGEDPQKLAAKLVAKVEKEIEDEHFREADKLMADNEAKLPKGAKEQLEKDLLKKWRQYAKKQPREDQKRSYEQILRRFPNDRETEELLNKINPDVTPIVRTLEQAEAKLALEGKQDWNQVLQEFSDVLAQLKDKNIQGRSDLWLRGHLGRARARARLKPENWQTKLIGDLEDVRKQVEPGDKTSRAYLRILELLTDASQRDKPGTLLDELVKFKNSGLLVKLDQKSWERKEFDSLTDRAFRDLLTDTSAAMQLGVTLTNPFPTPQAADRTYQTLDKAYGLLEEAPPDQQMPLQALLALAARYKTNPDDKRARELLADSMKGVDPDKLDDKLGALAVPLRLLHANLQDDTSAGRQVALGSYAKIIALSKVKEDDEAFVLELYQKVLAPAMAKGEAELRELKDAALAKQVGQFYAVTGRCIRHNLYAGWPFGDLKAIRQKAYAVYSRAVELDSKKADFLIGKVYARSDLDKPDWMALETDARTAISLAQPSEASEAEGLLGYVLLLRSRSKLDPEARVRDLKSAAEAYRKAIDLAEKSSEKSELAKLLTSRSTVRVELANFDRASGQLKNVPFVGIACLAQGLVQGLELMLLRDYLEQARADADRATKLKHRYPEYPWRALGNALEDLAWIVKDREAERYKKAIEAFTEAIKARDFQARPWIDRGRCQIKSFGGLGKKDASLLDSAKGDLEEALRKKPEPAEEAEARYWLGEIARGRGSLPEAKQNFQQAAKLAPADSIAWVTYTLSATQVILASASAQFDTNPHNPAILAELKEVQASTEKLKPFKTIALAREGLVRDASLLEAEVALVDAESRKSDDPQARRSLETAQRCADKLEADVPIEAARIRGYALQLKGNPKQAMKLYETQLPRDVTKAEIPALRLLLAYVNCAIVHYSKLDSEHLTWPDIVRYADHAIELAGDPSVGPSLRVLALGYAGESRIYASFEAGLAVEQRNKYREEALEKLGSALDLAPEHPRSGYWSGFYGKALLSLIDAKAIDAKKQLSCYQKVVPWLTRAEKNAPTAIEKRQFKDLYEKLRERCDSN